MDSTDRIPLSPEARGTNGPRQPAVALADPTSDPIAVPLFVVTVPDVRPAVPSLFV
jgi:hypothetical protein